VIMAGGALFWQPLAFAQTASGGSTEAGELEEVVVTANRVEQNLQKVSAAVQVIGGEELSQQALATVSQIFQSTPSVNITAQPAGFSINIRGQGADLPSGSQQGAVATEFDGIYNITSLATQVGFFDVDRIEVLPGPQSTRYGPNADGGVVNIISKDPTFGNFDGTGTFTYGNYNLRRLELGQNIPLGDKAAIRVSGAMIDRGSYFEPATTNAIAQSGRVKFLYQPNDNLSVKLWVQLDHTGGTGQGTEPRYISVYNNYPGDAINDSSYACSPAQLQYSNLDCANPWDHGNSSSNGVPNNANHANLYETTYAGTVSYRFNEAAVLDVTASDIIGSGYQIACYAGFGTGGDFGCFKHYPFDPFHEFATEVRVHSAPDSKITWSAGYYRWNYTNTAWSIGDQQLGMGPGAVDNPGPVGGTRNGVVTNAMFGDIIYPFTDRFRGIAGLRNSADVRESRQNLSVGVNAQASQTFSHVDYRVGEEFDLTPESMQYFTLSSGYRPGTWSWDGTLQTFVASQNEVITAGELGLKNRFLDNRLQVNADVFYYNERDYQIGDNYNPPTATVDGVTYQCTGLPNGVQPPAQCAVPPVFVQAYALGAETQVRYNPTLSDRISFTGTYLDAKFNADQTHCAVVGAPTTPGCWYAYGPFGQAPSFANIQGYVQPHSPKFAGNLGYNHVFHVGSMDLDAGAQAFYSMGYFVHPIEITTPALASWQPSYWLENVSVNLTPARGIWSLSGYIRNLSNYAVKQSYAPMTSIGEPRTYGLTLNVKW